MIFLSPGVYTKETDLSQIIAGIDSSTSAIVLQSKKGEVGTRVFVSSVKQLLKQFGAPNPKLGWGIYCALAFLNQGKQLWVTRVAPQAVIANAFVFLCNGSATIELAMARDIDFLNSTTGASVASPTTIPTITLCAGQYYAWPMNTASVAAELGFIVTALQGTNINQWSYKMQSGVPFEQGGQTFNFYAPDGGNPTGGNVIVDQFADNWMVIQNPTAEPQVIELYLESGA